MGVEVIGSLVNCGLCMYVHIRSSVGSLGLGVV